MKRISGRVDLDQVQFLKRKMGIKTDQDLIEVLVSREVRRVKIREHQKRINKKMAETEAKYKRKKK